MAATADLGGLLIDTGAFIALANPRDQYHRDAAEFYRRLPPSVLRLTSQAVIGESYTWLRYNSGMEAAYRFLDNIETAVQHKRLRLLYVSEALDQAARIKLRRYRDQDLSYVDAISLALLDELPSNFAVFAFDRHLALTSRLILPGPMS